MPALSEIQRSLHIGLSSAVWVIIGYLLVITLLSTQVGRLGDLFGRVRMYESGFVVFALLRAMVKLTSESVGPETGTLRAGVVVLLAALWWIERTVA